MKTENVLLDLISNDLHDDTKIYSAGIAENAYFQMFTEFGKISVCQEPG